MSSSTDRKDHVKSRGSIKLNQRPSLKTKSASGVEQDEESKFKVHASAFRGLARAANMRSGVSKYKAVRELEKHVAVRWRSLFPIYSHASSAFMSAIANKVIEFKLNKGDVIPRRGGAVFMVHKGSVSIRIGEVLICMFHQNQIFGEYDDSLSFQDTRVSVVAESLGTIVHAFKADSLAEIEKSWSKDPTWLSIKEVHGLYNWRWRYKLPLFEMYTEEIEEKLKLKWRKNKAPVNLYAEINPRKHGSSNGQLVIMAEGKSSVRFNGKYSDAFKAMNNFPVDVLPAQSCVGLDDILAPEKRQHDSEVSDSRCIIETADTNNVVLYHISGSDFVPVINKNPWLLRQLTHQAMGWRQMEQYLKRPHICRQPVLANVSDDFRRRIAEESECILLLPGEQLSIEKWSMHDFVLVRSGLINITLINGKDEKSGQSNFLENASKMKRYNIEASSAATDESSNDKLSGGDHGHGTRRVIGHLEQGEHLGASLFFGISEVRNVNLIAQEVSEVLVFRANSFYKILEEKRTGDKEKTALLQAAAADLRAQRFFNSFTTTFLAEIVCHFDSVIYAPGEKIIKSGAIGDELFILKEGSAAVVLNGLKRGTMEPVCVFGEIVVLGLTRERNACVIAETMCRVNALPGEKFRSALLRHPDAMSIFEDLAADRLKTIAGESCRRCNLFANCSDDFTYKMDLYSERRVIFPGRAILKSSQTLDKLFVIQQGEVEVVRSAVFDENGHFVSGDVIRVVPRGEVIGDLEIFGGVKTEPYSLVARGFVHVREVPADDFHRVIGELHDDRKIISRAVVAQIIELLPYSNCTFAKVPLFAAFSESFLKMVENVVSGDILSSNGNIVSEGGPIGSAVVVVDGVAQIMCQGVVVGYLKAGCIFGEQCLFDAAEAEVWQYSVKAWGRCIVQHLDRAKFRDITHGDGHQLLEKDDISRVQDLRSLFEGSHVTNNFGRVGSTADLVGVTLKNTPFFESFSQALLDDLSRIAIEKVIVEGQLADRVPGTAHDSVRPRTVCNNALVMVLAGNVEYFELTRYV